jgi:hypothetical protein
VGKSRLQEFKSIKDRV